MKFEILHRCSTTAARRGRIVTAHAAIETPVFMPVGTQGSVKGVSQQEVAELGFAILLGNTYHLHLRPGDIIPRGNDHVVATGDKMEIASGVLDKGIAGQVPAIAHVDLLPGIGETTRSGPLPYHAVALLQGVWNGSGWGAHWINAAALLVLFAVYTALATRVFRWE